MVEYSNPNDNGHVDLANYDDFTGGPPHKTFKRLRDEDPCHWSEGNPAAGISGFWSLTRYSDIVEHNKNHELLSSAQGIRMEDQTPEEYMARRTFQETDPPEHTHTRMLVAKAFSKPVIAEFEPLIRRLCDDILDEVLPKGEFDAAKEVARQLPMRMLGQILGTPDEDLAWLVDKGDELIANTDPEYSDHILDKVDTDEYRLMPFRSPAGAELWEYAKDLMEKKKASGDNSGVLNLILQPNAKGETITDEEFRNFFCLLVAAGNDTTRYSISSSINAIASDPALFQQLKNADDALWETASDEFIRWASPTMYFRRTATADFELHGKQIKKGDKVIYWFPSANRDERHFDNPYQIDLTRSPNRHMAFGQGGPHICLGMWLARLEVRVLMQEMAKRIDTIEHNGEKEFVRSNFVGGIKKLPVKVTLQS